ncbi:unnamed protein product [Brachionus calyciflorus]|uniref:Uncharacterized protein n=1 Tax=Brachionus calyciflorus TaxID=104777 RepID=A0A813SBV0_9BILA|nr:unnamed protein product [Brachionus calyciflorus]
MILKILLIINLLRCVSNENCTHFKPFFEMYSNNINKNISKNEFLNNRIMNLKNFKNFSEIDFNCLQRDKPIPNTIKLIAYKALSLDITLNMDAIKSNFRFLDRIILVNLDNFDLNTNFYRNFHYPIEVEFYYSKFEVIQNGKVSCEQNLNLKFDSNSNSINILFGSTIYFKKTCPLIFSFLKIDILKFYGISDAFIKKNMLGFKALENSSQIYKIKNSIFNIFKVNLSKSFIDNDMLNNNNKFIRIKGFINYIESNLFEKMTPKLIRFITEDYLSLFKDGGYWLNSFELVKKPLTSDNFFEIIIDTYKPLSLDDENICYFKHVPSNRAYLITPSVSYFNLKCTCSFSILFSTYLNLKNDSYNFKSYYTQLIYESFQKKKCLNQSFLSQCLDKVKRCNPKLFSKISPDYNMIDLSLKIDYFDIILSQIIILFGILSNLMSLVVLLSGYRDINLNKETSTRLYRLMIVNSLINFVYFSINFFHIINRCVEINGLFCSPVYRSKISQYYLIYFVEYLGSIVKFWSSLTLIAISIARLNPLSNKKFFINSKTNHYLFLFILAFSILTNLDKLFVIRVNENEFVLDFDFGNEFPDRNTFINSMSIVKLDRKIEYNGSDSIIFYVLFLLNFIINDIVLYLILTCFDFKIYKSFSNQIRLKKLMTTKLSEFENLNYKVLNLSNNKIKEVADKLLWDAKNIQEIYFDYNEIVTLPANFLKDLYSLSVIYFNGNKIRSISDQFFNIDATKNQIDEIHFRYNQIDNISKGFFKNLTHAEMMDFSGNKIKHLPKSLFSTCTDLVQIIFSKNRIQALSKVLFKGLTKLQDIYMEQNCIDSLDSALFQDLTSLNLINFSNNQIKSLPSDLFMNNLELENVFIKNNKLSDVTPNLVNNLNNLKMFDLSKNFITSIPDTFFENNNAKSAFYDFSYNKVTKFNYELVNEEMYNFISLAYNINFNNLDYLFDSLFYFYSQMELVMLMNCGILNEPNYSVLYRDSNTKHLNQILYVIFYNKPFEINEIDYEKKIFEYMINDLNNYKLTILDFLIQIKHFSDDDLICLQRYVNTKLSKTTASNYDFKINSPESLVGFFKRNDTFLFDSFFPKSSFLKYITFLQNYVQNDEKLELRIYDDYSKSDIINGVELKGKDRQATKKYVFNREFFLEIDYVKCFDIALENNNEKMVLHLIVLLKFSIVFISVYDVNFKFNDHYLSDARFGNIRKFQQKFLSTYLRKIFELEWIELVFFILEMSKDNYFIDLIETDNGPASNQVENEVDQVDFDPFLIKVHKDYEVKCEKVYSKDDKEISKKLNPDLIRHEKIDEILHAKWKLIPRFIYYFNLITYTIFLIFYSIKTEIYKYEFESVTTFVPLVLLIYLLILELIQLIDSLISKNILIYLTSFKNIFELSNFSMCIAALFLEKNDWQNALYSITLIFSYCILVFRLNKAWKLGIYVDVIGNIIRKSLGLLIVVLIFLIGFLLSFRNRSQPFSENDNPIEFFNSTFELSFFKILTMGVGSLSTDDMGVENINGLGFINCAIYATFIVIMPVLLINIFTGISIDEVQKLIENSEVQMIINKIEYVIKLDGIYAKFKNSSCLYFLYVFVYSIEKLLKKRGILKYLRSLVDRFSYLQESIENYKKQELRASINTKKDDMDLIDKKLRNILIELKQISIKQNEDKAKKYNHNESTEN